MKKNLYILLSTLALTSCTNPQQKYRDEISAAEKVLFADSTMIIDKTKAGELMKLYIAYADQFQDDSSSADYLFKAGDIANNMRQPTEAIALFGRVRRYQTYAKVPVALFLQGFITETELQDYGKAKEYYESFLQKYPNHQLTRDVQASLDNLGKSPEDLIKEFEANQKKQDSLAVKQ